jgi:hypothetical protein
MFASLKRLARNTTKLNVSKIMKSILDDKDLQLDIANLNKEQMYEDGILDTDTGTVFDYAPATVFYKQNEAGKLGRDTRSDHITLKDTGEFYDSISVKSEKERFVIKGDMIKDGNDLEEQFPKALGLTDENKAALQGLILPILRETVLQEIRQ